MEPIHIINVVPSLPPELEPLRRLAGNLRWAWHQDTIDLFEHLDPELWVESGRNPVALLAGVNEARLEELAADEHYREQVRRADEELDHYLRERETWFARTHGDDRVARIGYFSMEYGITDCVSIFSGGLGMLAGDHLKSASDLGIPLVGVGLFYHEGYFAQRLNDAGWQQEVPASNDVHSLPLALERDDDGEPVTVELGFPEGPIVAQIWRANVGRIPLFLLDANVSANTPDQRRVTHHLYGGDSEMRIRQEILLGIGGFRALDALGYEPSVYHMNEGHSAFLGLERIRGLMEAHALTFDEAREIARAELVFTTHTPVEAGHDYFAPDLVSAYFQVYAKSLGLSWDEFLGLGRQDPHNPQELYCMTVLALRLAGRCNGVSRLHGEVSRTMWQNLWPSLPRSEVPLGHITNGVHLQSWLSSEMAGLYDREVGTSWRDTPVPAEDWGAVGDTSPHELWQLHERRRHKLVDNLRRRVRAQRERRGASPSELADADELFDPHALTIGFARRFATYKRATLIARDRERLARIFADTERPVQLVVAGKAHPLDDGGKELIRQLFELSREDPFRGRIVFVEDYHMALARYLVQGCDVWLNNPVRPREASGTSGMKAAANGVLNLSTLDGWWDEAWADLTDDNVPFGWAIGRPLTYDDPERQDDKDAEALYSLLEYDVIPTFYDRGEDGLPWSWIARMKSSMQVLTPRFSTHRMLREYTEDLYLPAEGDAQTLTAPGQETARSIAAWRRRVVDGWSHVSCTLVEGPEEASLALGDPLEVRARVELGDLEPDDVRVELYLGPIGVDGQIHDGRYAEMVQASSTGDGYVYVTDGVRTEHSGRYGFTVRARAYREDLPSPYVDDCITWARTA